MVGTQVMEAKPNLIGPPSGEVLAGPVGGNRQVVMAAGGAYAEPPWRSCPDAVVTHEACDAATACRMPLGPRKTA